MEKLRTIVEEIKGLKKQLEYLRSGEYYNQLRFERDMLQNVVDNGEVSKEDKKFIDMTHRNTELLKENQELKKQKEELRSWLEENIICYENSQNTNLGEYERKIHFDLYNVVLGKLEELEMVTDE